MKQKCNLKKSGVSQKIDHEAKIISTKTSNTISIPI